MRHREMTSKEISNAANALIDWLASQNLTEHESVPVLALATAAIVVAEGYDPDEALPTIHEITARAVAKLGRR